MSDASKRPWSWHDHAEGRVGFLCILDANGDTLAGLGDMEMVKGYDIANAELIVAAVNGYDALRAAALAVVEAYDGNYRVVDIFKAIDALRVALGVDEIPPRTAP